MTTSTIEEPRLVLAEDEAKILEMFPPQGEWTEENYLQLTDDSNLKVEWTDGFLELLPMPTRTYQAIIVYFTVMLYEFITPRNGIVLNSGLRLKVRHGKMRLPDVALLLSKDDERNQERFWPGADFAIEVVGENKPKRDYVEKRIDYAEGRISEYWIVDPRTEEILVLKLEGNAYVEVGKFERGQDVSSVVMDGFRVSVDKVFDA